MAEAPEAPRELLSPSSYPILDLELLPGLIEMAHDRVSYEDSRPIPDVQSFERFSPKAYASMAGSPRFSLVTAEMVAREMRSYADKVLDPAIERARAKVKVQARCRDALERTLKAVQDDQTAAALYAEASEHWQKSRMQEMKPGL